MKKRKQTQATEFRIGDLYLFHTSNPHCPSSSSLWGLYGVIYLEHSSHNLLHFRQRHPLSKEYRHYRLATRSELRDYMYNIGYNDGKKNKVSR